jgi:hypothetical protein
MDRSSLKIQVFEIHASIPNIQRRSRTAFFAYSLSQIRKGHSKGTLRLEPAIKNREPPPSLLRHYYEYKQADTAITEILDMASMEIKEMQEDNFPDEDHE